ncbi:Autophagy-related 10 [Fusarium beomiforme]|uniref:Autophagy-related 10 n=1 Tax=Fusarium beomiforme TaxID=44412 RepID=A0A9P5AE70_9HYPO|nr:Autophagy-related 10 [Fusarium beomiforme]
MLDAEEADEAALIRQRARPEVPMVEYEIHLHPTYRVPCLWFNLRNLPANESAFDVDTVLRRLVPDEYKAGLRALGNVGGISADVSLLKRAARTSQLQKFWVSSRLVGLTNTLVTAPPYHGCPILLCPPLSARRRNIQIRVR